MPEAVLVRLQPLQCGLINIGQLLPCSISCIRHPLHGLSVAIQMIHFAFSALAKTCAWIGYRDDIAVRVQWAMEIL